MSTSTHYRKRWLALDLWMPDGFSTFLRKLFIEPTSHGLVQFFRYGFVAIIAFAIDFGLLYVFTSILSWHYLLSTTSSFTISAAVNYMLTTAWVFAQRDRRDRNTELMLFISICVMALLLNDLLMWAFTSALGIFYLASKLITVVIVLFWSFGARRLVFHGGWFRHGWPRKILTQPARADD
jgi:putative flippase GtrA